MELGEGLKKILLVGIGTAAVTAEKSKEILDELVKKGELTVEQGKVLNQELKHNIKSTVKTAADSAKESAARKNDQEELKATISKLTPEQLAAVKAQIESMQAEAAKEKEEASEAAEEPVEEAALEAPVEAERSRERRAGSRVIRNIIKKAVNGEVYGRRRTGEEREQRIWRTAERDHSRSEKACHYPGCFS